MLVAAGSVKGSPGVTTFTLALAARWPEPATECLVVEADSAGGDVAIRFELPTMPGLVSLAAAARRDGDPRLVWGHAQTLPGGLPVVVGPVGVEQARGALGALGEDAGVLRRAGDLDRVVVVADCGRLDPGSATLPVLQAADQVLLMVRAHTADLAHVAARLAMIGQSVRRLHLLLVGPGHAPREVARELGVPVLGIVPEDRRGAAALCGHPGPRPLRPSRSALGRAAARVAAKLTAVPSTQEPAGTIADAAPAPNSGSDAVALAPPNAGTWYGRRS